MSNFVGLSIISAFLFLEMLLAILLWKGRLPEKGRLPVLFLMVLLPAILLTVLDRWEWPSTINATVDLPYSWFHLMFVALALLFAVGATRLANEHTQKDFSTKRLSKTDWTVFLFGIFLLGIETYKQIFFGTLFSGYQWYLFPFQFCSVPIYVCLVAPWLKNKKQKDGAYAFIAIFGMIAGLAVMAIPTTVYVQRISICIHTMIWHGGMTVIGTYLLARCRIGTAISQWFQASKVLSLFIVIAIVLSMALHLFAPSIGLNPFFLSPWHASPFPVLSTLLANGQSSWGIFWGWLVYLIAYVVVFYVGGLLVYLVAGIFTHKPHAVFSKQPA